MSEVERFQGTREIYLRHKDKAGNEHVSHHFVWDAPRFVSAQKQAATKEKGSCEQITKDQYDLARK